MGATFYNGGPRALVWGCLLVVIGSLSQALSMAELGSILPIAGAQYHWTDMLAPDSSRRVITWFQGWVTWFAWVSALGGSSSSLAFILQGIAAENIPSYAESQKSWHLTLIMIGILITTGLINSFAFRIVPWLELASGVFHVILFFIVVGVFAGLGSGNSAEFVFTEGTSGSGWGTFVAFNIGMLVPAWGFIGFDGVNHMSEEVRKAHHAVPRAMVYTILINGALALIMALVIMFQMGNITPYLDYGYPIIPILMTIAGTKAANALISGFIIITYCVVAASLASVGRITWAWARDGALPKYFAHVDRRHKVPVRALWLPIVIVSLLSLLNIGSTAATAFSAFTSLSSLGLYSSYIIAISVLLNARLTGILGETTASRVQYGEWRLPKMLAVPINIYALIWTIYITIYLPFPTTYEVTGTNMNYSLPIYVFVLLCACIGWFAWGRSHWSGLNASAIALVRKES
jgi:choline transport protein